MVREVPNDDIYYCHWCGWEGTSNELEALGSYTKDEVEEMTGMSFETLPEPFHQCPDCGEPTPQTK